MMSNTETRRLNRIIQVSFKAVGPNTKPVAKEVSDLLQTAIAAKIAIEAVADLSKANLALTTAASGGINLVFASIIGATSIGSAMNLKGGTV